MFRIHRGGGRGVCSRSIKSHTEIRKRKEARLALWGTESQSLLLTPYSHFLLPFQPFTIPFHSSSFIKLSKSTAMHCWQNKTANHYCRLPKTQFLFQCSARCQWRNTCLLYSRGGGFSWLENPQTWWLLTAW